MFVSDKFLEKAKYVKSNVKMLKHIICFDEPNDSKISSFNLLSAAKTSFDITKNSSSDDIASLIYTSGTSGNPKAVMLTHYNLLYELTAGKRKFDFNEKDSFILVLPLYHIFAFTTVFLFSMSIGASIAFTRSLKKNEIFETIKETKTTVVCGIPQLFEAIYKGIMDGIEEQPSNIKILVRSLRLGNQTSVALFKKNIGKILFKKIHEKIGNTIKLMISGGAAIKKEVLVGLYLLGFPIVEGYGLSEASPVVAVNDLQNNKFGSVGKPLEGVQIRINNPNEEGIGEILVKGQIVMRGYYKNQELTSQTIKDGWLYTKDLGRIDKEGYLHIKGRKDSMIVLSSGKNVYPEDIEHYYSKSSLIQEICVVGHKIGGHDNEIIHALIVPNQEEAKKKGISNIYEEIKKEIEFHSRNLHSYRKIFSFDIIDSSSLPKTSTLKFKKFEIKGNLSLNTISKMPQKIQSKGKVDDIVISIVRGKSSNKNVSLNSNLETDLYLDSLSIAEIVSDLEDRLKIKCAYEEFPSLRTVQDLINLTGKNINPDAKMETTWVEDDSSIPRKTDYSEEGKKERINWIKMNLKIEPDYLSGKQPSAGALKGNIEHYIGMSQIPNGIAGPIKINGEYAKGNFYVPLATTEGALVSSIHRGMNVITKSGGANAKVLGEQLTKAPVFIFKNAQGALEFEKWIGKNFDKIKSVSESATNHGKLLKIDTFLVGRRLIAKLCFSCGDAMGANMITMMTRYVISYINSNYKVDDMMFQSNLEGEKKVTHMNFVAGRGKRIYADAIIKKEIVEKYLHTNAERMAKIAQNSAYGSMMSGMIGANAHIANIMTAIFIATGQDVAHVHDSSIGITTIDVTNENDLYIAVNLPGVAIGTIGGGTGLGTQRECLEMIGCSGTGKVNKLGEIIAASALAGELSLAASQAAGDFASAHDKLGRNRPSEKE